MANFSIYNQRMSNIYLVFVVSWRDVVFTKDFMMISRPYPRSLASALTLLASAPSIQHHILMFLSVKWCLDEILFC